MGWNKVGCPCEELTWNGDPASELQAGVTGGASEDLRDTPCDVGSEAEPKMSKNRWAPKMQENWEVWKLAVESGAMQYNEEDDIMAIPQSTGIERGLIETKKEVVTNFDIVQLWGNGAVKWEFVGSVGASVYGPHDKAKKLVMWEELSFLSGLCQVPFCYQGDFNEITHMEERKGTNSLMVFVAEFKSWIQDMELVDLAITDRLFTWFRGQSYSRIDRVLVSLEWLEEFPEIRLRGGPRGLSDHCPLMMEVSRIRGGPKPFRSLDSWFTHDGFLRMVKEEWRILGEVQFMDKLKALMTPLSRWHKKNFRFMDTRIRQFKDEIKKVDDMVGTGVADGTIEAKRKALVSFCRKWYIRKELHWKQMSRSRHVNEMDKNIRYFNNLASARRRSNWIDALMVNGRLEEATELEMMPTTEEIKEAVWDCESTKTPGSDGYNMNFIKKCWEELDREFTEAVKGFFQLAKLPSKLNVTWVALAPKFTGAKEIKDLRSISMVGCVYKVISTVLIWRMRKKMGFGQRWRGWIKECVCFASMMIGEAVRNGRISLLLVGSDNIELSHLQFANDTILFCPPKEETIRNYQQLLRYFELMSGLSINFEKSNIIPVNCDRLWVRRMCLLLGCMEASLPIRYLGIPLGANPRLVKTWKPVIDKVEEKLNL
ncbi:uncharacterized protein LOC130949963 [Arachis stenosperma]|uniref:uncharacterized protein LOC130949963 n=1 Tax=Arachis stenosperma TaxID=217475 RepID=UPI0025AD83CE|nr:uncharacterized protein LOC130949963 [Arachis stenosperma]